MMMGKPMGRSKRPLGFGTKKLRDSQWQQVVEKTRAIAIEAGTGETRTRLDPEGTKARA